VRDALVIVFVAIVLLMSRPALAGTEAVGDVDVNAAVARSQARVGEAVGDFTFRDTGLREVRISDFAGKPLIVSLVYTGCADMCPTVSQALAAAAEAAQETFGVDGFNVVTIGFDPKNDTPQRMHDFARSQGLNLANWQFLSGDPRTIEGLSEALGFTFRPSPRGFDHLAQTSVLDASGRVFRQIYGADFEPPALVEPLKELIFGERASLQSWDGIVNKVRLLCTFYDPATGRYGFDYSIFIGFAIGALCLVAMGFVIVRALFNSHGGRRNMA